MLVITGAPGSGKSHRILGHVRAGLARGADDFRLLVPTATMAEHLRHRMAREVGLLRPGLIQTLSGFVSEWSRDYSTIPPAALEVLLARALSTNTPARFAHVAELPGFRATLASVIEEFSSGGWDSWRLARVLESAQPEAPSSEAFLAVYHQIEKGLLRRGWVPRAALLKLASEYVRTRGLAGVSHVLLDGFFTLSDPELELIDAIHGHADVTIALPRWEGSEGARAALIAIGFEEQELDCGSRRTPRVTLVTAARIDGEVEEIARRILEEVAGGRQFREIGVVLRERDPYVPLLRPVLERFGIPARFYFTEPLSHHPVVRYLTGVVEAMQGGWDHQATLEALKMIASGFGATPACDRFEFEVMKRLPGQGLNALRELSDDPRLHAMLDRFAALGTWAALPQAPKQWVASARKLHALLRPPAVRDGVSHETAAIWRAQAAALEEFDQALEETAGVLGGEDPIPFLEFWRAATIVLEGTQLRVPDARRNVVHVMDVYEARQWELPVVFVCGLLEKQFPVYHGPDPLFPEAARQTLNRAGMKLKTAANRQREEEFLFEVAVTRASAELVLSYPEFNEKGDLNLPSFFLDRVEAARAAARDALPASTPRVQRPSPRYLEDPDLVATVRGRHATLRPTSIETFLGCPYRFFAEHTLELKEPPAAPAARLSPPLRGQIVHQTLAELERSGEPLDAVFGRVFDRVCARERVIGGCRTEMAHMTMLRDLRRYAGVAPRLDGWDAHVEEDIEFPLDVETEISGRIDRFEISGEQAVVIDYKYSGAHGIQQRMRGYEEGKHVQGALYLLGLNAIQGLTPAGMFYCGLRGEVKMDGWHSGLPEFQGRGQECTPQQLWERLEAARAVAIRAASEIHRGCVEAAPEDGDRCSYCMFQDVCRAGGRAAAEEAGE